MDEFEQNRILNMLNDIGSDFSDELGIGDENISETEDHLSENDEYGTEEELETSDEEIDQSERRFLWGKDKLTKWRKDSCQTIGRTRSHNIITQLPGPKLVSRDKYSIVDCFKLFCDDIIIKTIVTCTNIYIEKISTNFKRQIDCRQTDFQEISALIGILILAGVNKSGKQNILDLWDKTGFGIESFHATMSIQRFRFLLRCLRFDDIRDRESRREIDKLAPIREVFEMLVHNCQKSYSVGAFVTIDEELVKFRGKCPFKQYLPSKPGKYGIKIFAVVDSKTMYSFNMEIYPGKQPEGPYNLLNNPHPLVMRLMEPILDSGRNLTIDNFFTSVPLAKDLLNRKITLVGTLRKNKREIPPEMLSNKRKEYDSLFGFTKELTIVSYVPKKRKTVLDLSSFHHDSTIDTDTDYKKKPEIITFYNSTKGGVDTVDEMCGRYDTGSSCKRWPLAIFFYMLNITGINSQIIYIANNPNIKIKRRIFLRNLAMELIKPAIAKRAASTFLPREIRIKAATISGQQLRIETTEREGSSGRCFFCPRAKDRKTKNSCGKCNKWICKDHLKQICLDCSNKYENADENEMTDE